MGSLRERLVAGLRAGLVVGVLVTGVGGRITMRLVALGQPRVPAFTLRGSLVVVLVGALFGSAGGILYGLIRHRLPGRGLPRGVLFGFLVAVLGLPIGFPLPALPASGHFESGDVVARVAFFLLSLVAGAALEGVMALDERRRPGEPPRAANLKTC